jgi:hypothetical protein
MTWATLALLSMAAVYAMPFVLPVQNPPTEWEPGYSLPTASYSSSRPAALPNATPPLHMAVEGQHLRLLLQATASTPEKPRIPMDATHVPGPRLDATLAWEDPECFALPVNVLPAAPGGSARPDCASTTPPAAPTQPALHAHATGNLAVRFVDGVEKGTVGMVSSSLHALTHPGRTLHGVTIAIAHPGRTSGAVWQEIQDSYARDPVYFLGRLTGSLIVPQLATQGLLVLTSAGIDSSLLTLELGENLEAAVEGTSQVLEGAHLVGEVQPDPHHDAKYAKPEPFS